MAARRGRGFVIVLALAARRSGDTGFLFDRNSPALLALLGVGTGGLYLSSIVGGSRGADALLRWVGLIIVWLVTALAPFVVFILYLGYVFPRIPSELGGPAPRCVRLDVNVDRLSNPMKEKILPMADVADSTSIRRTHPLTLFFEGGGLSVVSVGTSLDSMRISSDAIVASIPCRDVRP